VVSPSNTDTTVLCSFGADVTPMTTAGQPTVEPGVGGLVTAPPAGMEANTSDT
jgi:hypothetical protein